MKERRNLSGIYFRSQNPESGKWENVVFEDLSEEEQDKFLEAHDRKWVESLAKQLANTINEIGNQLDLMKD